MNDDDKCDNRGKNNIYINQNDFEILQGILSICLPFNQPSEQQEKKTSYIW